MFKRSPERIYTIVFILLLVLVEFLLIRPFLSKYDGQTNPVVEEVILSEISYSEEGARFNIEFEKIRPCYFKAVWLSDGNGKHYDIVFPSPEIISRPLGFQQDKSWFVPGLTSTMNVEIVSKHRCNWFYPTITRFKL